MTTPADFLKVMAARGVSLRLAGDGKLLARPAGQLRPLEVFWVKTHRAELIAHLGEIASPASQQPARPDDGRQAALAAFDALSPTQFDGSPADAQRVLLRWPGQSGWLVLTQPELDFILAWNQAARERAGKVAGSTTRRSERKAGQKALYAHTEELV